MVLRRRRPSPFGLLHLDDGGCVPGRLVDLVKAGAGAGLDGGDHGALDDRGLGDADPVPSSISSSMASWAESTADPRSTRTSTPSPSSAAAMASAIRVASVPMPPSSVPPAAWMRTSSAICPASSTTPSAILAEWDTTTRPTVTGPPPPAPVHAKPRPTVFDHAEHR